MRKTKRQVADEREKKEKSEGKEKEEQSEEILAAFSPTQRTTSIPTSTYLTLLPNKEGSRCLAPAAHAPVLVYGVNGSGSRTTEHFCPAMFAHLARRVMESPRIPRLSLE